MAEDDKSMDIAGIGKLAQAIPKEGWNKLIDVASSTFADLIAPITKTTAGLGGLIQAKFDTMIDTQKVFAADAVNRAKEKVGQVGGTPKAIPKAKVLLPSIENASLETDDDLRDIWANLIANELIGANVHPEFPSVLSRLDSHDAMVLSEIAEKSNKETVQLAAKYLSKASAIAAQIAIRSIPAIVRATGLNLPKDLASEFKQEGPGDFSTEHLERLNLIKASNGDWKLTYFGEEFVKAVTDPNYSKEAPAPNND